jgi:hypothetical protein
MATVPALNHAKFAADVLHGIGISNPTRTQVGMMLGWMAMEGGHTNGALWNPLNTTQPEPGAGNTGTQGNIKVYRSYDQGVQATVTTLKNGHYGAIISAFKAGDPSGVASAIDSSPWGTHGDILGAMFKFISHPFGGSAGSLGSTPDGKEAEGGSDATGFQKFAAGPVGDVIATPAEFLTKLAQSIFSPAWWARIGMYAGGIALIGLGLVLFARDYR